MDKIIADQAEGILLAPLWPTQPWFTTMMNIAIKWWDIPSTDHILHSRQASQRLSPINLRIIVFNAFNYSSPIDPIISHTSSSIPLSQFLHSVDWENPTDQDLGQLRSVIASTLQHPDAAAMVQRIQQLYTSELHEPKLAWQVDSSLRGPFGIAKIELKDSARPLARKPFRTLGEREDALRNIIDKYLDRGWIQPSRSEWAAQAFVVPKPATADNQKQ